MNTKAACPEVLRNILSGLLLKESVTLEVLQWKDRMHWFITSWECFCVSWLTRSLSEEVTFWSRESWRGVCFVMTHHDTLWGFSSLCLPFLWFCNLSLSFTSCMSFWREESIWLKYFWEKKTDDEGTRLGNEKFQRKKKPKKRELTASLSTSILSYFTGKNVRISGSLLWTFSGLV